MRERLSSGSGVRRARVVVVIGTRPEAIKMAPVVKALERCGRHIDTIVVCTAQHRQMLDQVLSIFGITPAHDLDLMQPDQSLEQVTVLALQGMRRLLRLIDPDLVLVQGDTTTTFAAALAAYYCQVPVGHIEAGLRTLDKLNPYPEEINRRLTTVLADYHFAPTQMAEMNLLREGVAHDRIFVTGNTVVDALAMMAATGEVLTDFDVGGIDFARERVILLTAHRRENWGTPLRNICDAVGRLVSRYDDIRVIYPVHPNPHVRETVFERLQGLPRVHLIEPLDYLAFIALMSRVHLILTDSGGIQEEAPSLGKPVLILRRSTERPEATEQGMARLIGTETAQIVLHVARFLDDGDPRAGMPPGSNPYGDGQAADRIVAIVLKALGIAS